MKKVIVLVLLLFVSFSLKGQASTVIKEQSDITMSVAEQMLEGQPVLVKDEDNSVGIIVEDLINFPKLSNNEVYKNTDTTKNSKSDILSLPTSAEATQSSIINLDGVATRVVLADFQQISLNVLRNGGRNPKAIFKKDNQTIVTPDGNEELVNISLAIWKTK